MAMQPRARTDFVIKDLVVSIPSAAGGGGRSFIPADDNGEPLPWWISPVAGVLGKEHVLEIARETVRGALKDQAALDSIGRRSGRAEISREASGGRRAGRSRTGCR